MDSKVCTSCKKVKTLSEFHRFGKNSERVGKWCEQCYVKKAARKPTAAKPFQA